MSSGLPPVLGYQGAPDMVVSLLLVLIVLLLLVLALGSSVRLFAWLKARDVLSPAALMLGTALVIRVVFHTHWGR
ncbi:hypothetical protein Gbth_016_010 [Gluconobacter thailandicus F149-1 = NBRC 100600]|uniref:Uncharacterized protein n=2 Tax=Gluconobacter thailandicus TaxID=257438 RepID=A0ABQ0ISS7_GLUTH|nr:hypothetical protein [Gluconobacter thailandicus]GAD25266.1 hypothetical protein NBRC3257_0265 [Gluconobacter thailandicus NBRC 3257]KXV54796.1 hypothetical protein AD946_01480 [Gluconobacter thailandicus]GAC89012.1 hypothetical protein NBRC3255_2673 [Gluconobacter thailandicus NBRC 3255]GAN92811.1 hypothetical protein Gbth_016_010 [Gluconobacter thailandicus F149-1 = NBRC 100600]GBR57127.1 hypothetical protein AA100600_0098 [Gluconobacter thailandicus F149-1 = NBRC 100600]